MAKRLEIDKPVRMTGLKAAGSMSSNSVRKVIFLLVVAFTVGIIMANFGPFFYSVNMTVKQAAEFSPSAHRDSLLIDSSGSKPNSTTSPKLYKKYLLSVFPGSQQCVPPEGSADLPKHEISNPQFRCGGDVTNMTDEERRTRQRRQMRISCDAEASKAEGSKILVDFSAQLQIFRTQEEKLCLHRYIDEHCYDEKPVPNVIHLLWYGTSKLDFRTAIGLYSIFTIARPCLVILHGNAVPKDPLWDKVLNVADNLVLVHKEPKRQINGRQIKHVQNMADIGRIEILIEYGGIYLDSDMVIIQKLDIFREVGFAANKAGSNTNLANGIMIAVPNHDVLKEWLGRWQTYDGVSWGSHSVLMLTQIARANPHRMSALGPIFIKFGFNDVTSFYKKECSFHESFAAHLYRRDYPSGAGLEYVKTAKTTYGRLARYVLFGDSSLCV